jgi:hypothetical protein
MPFTGTGQGRGDVDLGAGAECQTAALLRTRPWFKTSSWLVSDFQFTYTVPLMLFLEISMKTSLQNNQTL